jgi:hypothetical protein
MEKKKTMRFLLRVEMRDGPPCNEIHLHGLIITRVTTNFLRKGKAATLL